MKPCADAFRKAVVAGGNAKLLRYRDKCGRRNGGWKAYMNGVWCWGGNKQIPPRPGHSGKRWTLNCTPVMDFYCGTYKGKVLKSTTGAKYHACDVCVEHFIAEKIYSFGCWRNTLHEEHYCDPAPAGVAQYNPSAKHTLVHEPQWLMAKPPNKDVAAYWNNAPDHKAQGAGD